ncbi:MAG: calcium-binding protein [Synechococcus sp. YX04-3]|nr:MAG: calcium-binding protein [Synechococcus sp. YX04-3]
MKEPILIGNQSVETLFVGTNKKDKITGSSEGDVLAGGVGKDVLKGGGGADGFLFNQPNEYGKKKADKIKDFDSDEGDSILVDKEVMGLGKKIKLKIVTGKKASKKAATSKMDFVYDGKKGLLYFNENGKEEGWGDGGLFAKLHGAPDLVASDFTIV